ncbi:MAG: WecB/TagA/CpsF family glycosyltransferase, partial [Trueperaceae bacterium]
LPDRVYGPELMVRTAKALAERNLSVYLYGSKKEVLERLGERLRERYPKLLIAGMEASKFRPLSTDEKTAVVERIWISGASAVFVGLGCPRQEVWAYEYRDLLGIPILAVGAAFDFHAGTVPQAPKTMQDRGLEWLFRLSQEPKRLWKRYLLLNPSFLWNVTLQLLNIRTERAQPPDGTEPIESFG